MNDIIINYIAKYCVNQNMNEKDFAKIYLAIKRRIHTILKKKTDKYFSLEDINKLLTFFFMNGVNFDYEKWKAIYYLIYYTGISRYELLNIKRTNFDLENCSLLIEITNWRLPRTVFYPEKIRTLLIKYFNRVIEDKNAFNLTSFKMDWQTRRLKNKKINQKQFNFNILRQSNTGLLIRNGINKQIIRYLKYGDIEIDINLVEKEYKDKIR